MGGRRAGGRGLRGARGAGRGGGRAWRGAGGEGSMEGRRPDVRVIVVPYDSGHRGLRMGAGPGHLLDNGLGEALSSEGPGLVVTTVRHPREPPAEVATAFELHGVV